MTNPTLEEMLAAHKAMVDTMSPEERSAYYAQVKADQLAHMKANPYRGGERQAVAMMPVRFGPMIDPQPRVNLQLPAMLGKAYTQADMDTARAADQTRIADLQTQLEDALHALETSLTTAQVDQYLATARAEGYAEGRLDVVRATVLAIYRGKINAGLVDVKFSFEGGATPAEKWNSVWEMEMSVLAGKSAPFDLGPMTLRRTDAPKGQP